MANFIDLTGLKFNFLTVISLNSTGKATKWNCLCDCGKEKVVKGSHLKDGLIKSCGCLRHKHAATFEDLTGLKFNKLTVLLLSPRIGKVTKWKCICDCGKERNVAAADLKSGKTKSCGCILKNPDTTINLGEIWKDIPNYEGYYQASNFGRIKSVAREKLDSHHNKQNIPERIMKQNTIKGYFTCCLCKNGKKNNFQVNRLIALTFIGESNLQADHIDTNKKNNRLDNLQYLAPRPNSHKRVFKKKSSKYLGVHKSNGKWRSEIYIGDRNIHLGYFINEEDARDAFLKALAKINTST